MMNTGFNGNYQIIQTKDYVAIQVEMNHDVRMIRMGDRISPLSCSPGWAIPSAGGRARPWWSRPPT